MKTRTLTLSVLILAFTCLFFASSAFSQPSRKQLSGSVLYESMMKCKQKSPGHFATFLGNHKNDLSLSEKPEGSTAYRADTVIRYSIFGGSEKFIYGFDINGKLLSILDQVWIIDKWADYNVITNVYDANGNLLTETSELFRSNTWLNYRKLSHTYDGAGNCMNTLAQQWDGTEWVNVMQSDYTYNGNGNMLTELFQQWDGSVWMNSSLDSCTYDGTGNRLTLLDQYWDGSAWFYSYLDSWTYDGTGNMLTYLNQMWDGMAWGNSMLVTYIYDGNGNRLTVLEQGWDGMAWMNWALYTWTYDANNNPLTGIFLESYDGVTWSNVSRNEWTYDATGNVITFTIMMADWMTGEWENYYNAVYSYQAGIITTDAAQWTGTGWSIDDAYFPVSYFSNSIATQFFSGGPAVRVTVYYSSFSTGTDAPTGDHSEFFTVFPNPTNKYLTIVPANPKVKIGKVQLYDLNGKEQQISISGYLIDISKLQNAVYLLKLTTLEGQTQNRKIVKK